MCFGKGVGIYGCSIVHKDVTEILNLSETSPRKMNGDS